MLPLQISIIKNNIIVGLPDFPGNCVQEAGVPGPEEEGKRPDERRVEDPRQDRDQQRLFRQWH